MIKIFKRRDRFQTCLYIIALLAVVTVFVLTSRPRDAESQFGTVGYNSWYHIDEDFETLTVGTATAVGFGTIKTTHSESSRVRFRVEDTDIRVRTDGGTPTSTVGELVKVDEAYQVIGYQNILNFEAIAVTGTATLPCTYATQKGMK